MREEVFLLSTNHLNKYREIGKKIAYYRTLRGMSQEDLAEKIDMSTSYISKIEAPNSTMTFSLEVLFEISLALNIDIALLFRPLEFADINKRIES